jgi:perosamine synthetase
LSFIATCNAISYLGAEPLFIDVDNDTLGLSPSKLSQFLEEHCHIKNSQCYHIATGKRIAACVPMHTFGHPVHLNELVKICETFSIPLVEDAAESIGSRYRGIHTGTFGLVGAFSFNGNKTITCGGGGAIVTNNERLAKLAKHLTTQAKIPHRWNFAHDQIGYNYRLPNLNAAMACAQMEVLDTFIDSKRQLALKYKALFEELGIPYAVEPTGSFSNYWLNAIFLKDENERDSFLNYSNDREVMTRPAWHLMVDLEMFRHCLRGDLSNARYIADRLVNLPSSPVIR